MAEVESSAPPTLIEIALAKRQRGETLTYEEFLALAQDSSPDFSGFASMELDDDD